MGWLGRWFKSFWDSQNWRNSDDEAEVQPQEISSPIYFLPMPKKKLPLKALSKNGSEVRASASFVAVMSARIDGESEVKCTCTIVFNVQRARRTASAMLFDLAA